MFAPPLYRGGIDLIDQGNTVSRALTYWKGVIYASVDAQTCYTGQSLSSATVYAIDVSNPTNLLVSHQRCFGGLQGQRARRRL